MARAKALTCDEAVSQRLTISLFRILGVVLYTGVEGGQSEVEDGATMCRCMRSGMRLIAGPCNGEGRKSR